MPWFREISTAELQASTDQRDRRRVRPFPSPQRGSCRTPQKGCAAHINVPEAQYQDTVLQQPSVAFGVALSTVVVAMAAAVHFDGDSQARAIEVENIRSGGMLAA